MADMNKYETVVIVSATVGEEGNEQLIERFKRVIEKSGVVESVDSWGKRRFAYPIEKENEGYYTLINFASTPDLTAELDRRYQITDGILRSLIIKKDPRQEIIAAKRAAAKAAAAEKAAAEKAAAEKAAAEKIAAERAAAEKVAAEKAAAESDIVDVAESVSEETNAE